MARPLRIEFPGAIYHVTSRGDRREAIFEDDEDRQSFIEVTAAALERFDACLLAYCLMGNHYHLVVHTRQGNLSRLMRQINGVYTQKYNQRHRKVGHLLQGRFKAILVDEDAYLLEVCRYVDLNPVRAHMVKRPQDWKWSSYLFHTGSREVPEWLDTPALHGYLLGRPTKNGRDIARAAQRYQVLVAQGKDIKLWEAGLRQQIYLGDEAFIERMQALIEAAKVDSVDVPRVQRRKQSAPIVNYFEGRHGREESIALAYYEGGYTMSAIASELNLSVSRISRVIAKYKSQAKGKT